MLLSADFTRADLTGASLYQIMAMTSFECADLTDTKFISCRLMLSNFKGAVLKGTDFSYSDMTDVDFIGIDLTDVTFKETIVTKSKIDLKKLTKEQQDGIIF